MSDIGDYELHPWTVQAMLSFRDGNDPALGERKMLEFAKKLNEEVIGLDDYTKGLVIIDLLTMCNVFEQIISALRVEMIEKGMAQ